MQWYVADEGTQNGPFSELALIAYLRARNLERVFVWREGFETWIRARDVPEIMRLVSNTHEASTGESRKTKSRKRRWARNGALIGLFGAASLLAIRGVPGLERLTP